MRTPNLGSVFYSPSEPPAPDLLPQYLRTELQAISAAITALSLGHLDKTTVAPLKPREGDLRFADGVSWDPGSGSGVYYYNGSIWKLLG